MNPFSTWTPEMVRAHNTKNRPPVLALAQSLDRQAKKKTQRMIAANGSELERKFVSLWAGPELQREFRFHESRRWRFDFAHLPTLTAIEVEGGVWSNGRHNRGSGFIADCEKYLEATLLGWTIYRLPSELITRENLSRIASQLSQLTP